MSSPRVQKIFEGMPDQLKRLGAYSWNIRDVIRWQGRVTAGNDQGRDAMLLDLDSATWADNNRRAILIAVPASDKNDQAGFKTQSHSQGQYIDGSVSFKLYLETPEDWTNDQARFGRLMQHLLVGQLSAPVEIFYCANDTEPTVQGVNGAGATAAFTSAGVYLPYGGVAVPGGI
jgi:hypothetical protein